MKDYRYNQHIDLHKKKPQVELGYMVTLQWFDHVQGREVTRTETHVGTMCLDADATYTDRVNEIQWEAARELKAGRTYAVLALVFDYEDQEPVNTQVRAQQRQERIHEIIRGTA